MPKRDEMREDITLGIQAMTQFSSLCCSRPGILWSLYVDLEWKPPVHHDLGDGECAFSHCNALGSPFHVVFTLEVASFKTLKIKGYENLFFRCDVAQKRNRVEAVRMTSRLVLRERSRSSDAQWNLFQHLMVNMLTGGLRTARVRDAELVENFHLKCKTCVITDEDIVCIWNQSPATTTPTWNSRDHRTARGTGEEKMTLNQDEKQPVPRPPEVFCFPSP